MMLKIGYRGKNAITQTVLLYLLYSNWLPADILYISATLNLNSPFEPALSLSRRSLWADISYITAANRSWMWRLPFVRCVFLTGKKGTVHVHSLLLPLHCHKCRLSQPKRHLEIQSFARDVCVARAYGSANATLISARLVSVQRGWNVCLSVIRTLCLVCKL